MIRMLITAAAFLTVTAVVLLLQPSPSDIHYDEVSRAQSDPLDLARDTREFTRPRAALQGDSAQSRPLAAVSAEAARALDNGPRAEGPVLLPGELRAQIVQAIGEGRDDSYIEALLRQAVERGERDVPTALITSRGRLDTHAVLEELERRDQSQTVLLGTTLPAPDPRPDVYTVEPGDSLAAIARKFYGRTEALEQIYEANRDRLGGRDALRPGQLLILPEL